MILYKCYGVCIIDTYLYLVLKVASIQVSVSWLKFLTRSPVIFYTELSRALSQNSLRVSLDL